jgi:hypothetical protein
MFFASDPDSRKSAGADSIADLDVTDPRRLIVDACREFYRLNWMTCVFFLHRDGESKGGSSFGLM